MGPNINKQSTASWCHWDVKLTFLTYHQKNLDFHLFSWKMLLHITQFITFFAIFHIICPFYLHIVVGELRYSKSCSIEVLKVYFIYHAFSLYLHILVTQPLYTVYQEMYAEQCINWDTIPRRGNPKKEIH